MIDGSKDPVASRRFDELIEAAQIAIEPVTEAQARIARQAYRDFGKTSGHPAKLNFGDCFSYALAKAKGEPLLFKGDDFSRTDVKWRGDEQIQKNREGPPQDVEDRKNRCAYTSSRI